MYSKREQSGRAVEKRTLWIRNILLWLWLKWTSRSDFIFQQARGIMSGYFLLTFETLRYINLIVQVIRVNEAPLQPGKKRSWQVIWVIFIFNQSADCFIDWKANLISEIDNSYNSLKLEMYCSVRAAKPKNPFVNTLAWKSWASSALSEILCRLFWRKVLSLTPSLAAGY